MTLNETLALLFLAKNMYPRDKGMDKSDDDMLAMAKVWTELLYDIPFEVGKAAVAAHGAGSPYAPAISEIRAFARKMTEPPAMSADEAWAIAQRTMRRYGCSPYKEYATGKYPADYARENTPPEVWQVMERMGYRSMCLSENTDVLRAQFLKAWERQQQRREEQKTVVPFLPEGLRATFFALQGGKPQENGDQCILLANPPTVP